MEEHLDQKINEQMNQVLGEADLTCVEGITPLLCSQTSLPMSNLTKFCPDCRHGTLLHRLKQVRLLEEGIYRAIVLSNTRYPWLPPLPLSPPAIPMSSPLRAPQARTATIAPRPTRGTQTTLTTLKRDLFPCPANAMTYLPSEKKLKKAPTYEVLHIDTSPSGSDIIRVSRPTPRYVDLSLTPPNTPQTSFVDLTLT